MQGSNALINQDLYFKNVSFKNTLLNTYPIPLTNTARGLMCPAVNNVEGVRATNGDITVRFGKRVRGLALLQDYIDAYDPDGDSYEVDIFTDSTYTIVKRTYAFTNLNFKYPTADQVSDFGANQATIYIKIYKLNAVIGRGYASQISI